MADQWEEAAKQFKPELGGASTIAPNGGNEDWKVWQQTEQQPQTPKPSAVIPQAHQFLTEHPYVRTAAHIFAPAVATGLDPEGSSEVGKGTLKQLGRDAYGLLEAAGPLGMAAHAISERTGLGSKIQRATEPANETQEAAGHGAQAAEMALPIPKTVGMLPNVERAGQNFERVMQIAGHRPVDLTEASRPVIRALELERAGAGAPPPVISRMAERIPQHSNIPMPFKEARDFASNAGRLSASESLAAKPQMKAQVSALAKALTDANYATAEKAGVGPLFRDAMTEYRRAKQIEGAKGVAADIAKNTAGRIVAGAGLGAGGYAAGRALGLFGER